MVSKVFVSIGSNIDREQCVLAALNGLQAAFGSLQISSVYESEAIGFDGDPFYNLVVSFNTKLTTGQLVRLLRKIEADNGRRRGGTKFSARTLDIDILTYDSLIGDFDGIHIPREEILLHAFVLRPLAEIVPNGLHPELQKSYQTLWQSFDQSSQHLLPIDFFWQDERISAAEA